MIWIIAIALLAACLYSAVKHNPYRRAAGLGNMRIVTAVQDPTILEGDRGYEVRAEYFAVFINNERVGRVFSADFMNQEAFDCLTRKQIAQLYRLVMDMVNNNELPLGYAEGAGKMRHCAVGSNWINTQAVYKYNTMTEAEFEDPSSITLDRVNEQVA